MDAFEPTEFAFRCALCGHSEAWTTERAAQAAAVWHVFELHQGEWIEQTGGILPQDPRPEAVGRRFQEWERQS